MKKMLFFAVVLMGLVVAAPGVMGAPHLVCDLPDPVDQVTLSEVEVTKVSDLSISVVPGLSTVRGSEFLLVDLATYAPTKYRFRARFNNATGWPSAWSPFLDAGPPGPAKGLRMGP